MDLKLLLTLGLIGFLLVMIFIWTTWRIAEHLHARQVNYRRILMIIILGFGVTGLVCVVIFSHFKHWWLSLFFIILIPSYVASKALELSVWRSFIAVYSAVLLSSVFGYILVLTLIFSGLFSGLGVGLVVNANLQGVKEMPKKVKNYAKLTHLKMKAEKVCRCIDKPQCFYSNMAKFNYGISSIKLDQLSGHGSQVLEQLQRVALDCYITFQNIKSRAKAWEDADLESDLTDEPLKTKQQFNYAKVPVAKLSAYQDRIIMLQLTSGLILQGRLKRTNLQHIVVRQFTEHGYKEESIRRADIEWAKVLSND